MLIGSHLGENMHNTQAQEFADAVGAGASIIVVDPRFSVAASKAKHYLPIKPGTDLALLLAWMNVLVSEGLYDKEYVAAHGFGFEAFAAEIAAATPEWAYPETGIEPDGHPRDGARDGAAPPRHARPPRASRDLVRRRCAAEPGDRAAERAARQLGTQGRVLEAGADGRARLSVPAVPARRRRARWTTRAGSIRSPARRSPPASATATLTGQPYPVKGWIVYATNLLHAMPDQRETIRAIQALDLLVVVDVIPSEIAGWADVVLPESTYLERLRRPERRVVPRSVRRAAPAGRPSPHAQKPNWWIARQLALKLGLGAYYPWTTIEEYLEHRLTHGGPQLRDAEGAGHHPRREASRCSSTRA